MQFIDDVKISNIFHDIFRTSVGILMIALFTFYKTSILVRTSEAPFVPFQENVKIRRREASRSILIGIQSEQCLLDLHTYCSQLGKVNKFIPCIESSNPSVRILN